MRRSRLSCAAGVVLVVGGVAACGGGEPPEADPSTSTEAPSSDATSTPGDEIEPADGQQVNTEHLSVNLPEGWRGEQELSLVTGAAPRGLLATIYINDLQVPGVPAAPLAKEARNTVRSLNEERDPEILDPIEVDGVEVYHLAGQVSSSRYVERFGPSIDDATVSIGFEFVGSVSEEERQEVIDSVLASVDWTF